MKTIYLRQYQEFLARLRQARKDSGLSQADLARRLKRPQSFVSKYENGERRLDVVEFLHLAQILGIDPGPFINDLGTALGIRTPSAGAARRGRRQSN